MSQPTKPYKEVACISVLRYELEKIEDGISSLGRLGDVQPQMWGRLQNDKVHAGVGKNLAVEYCGLVI